MKIQPHPIRALQDNYIWCLVNSTLKQAVVVDPGEAAPVITFLGEHHLQLAAILITHHHWDHTNGIKELTKHSSISVYGASKAVNGVTNYLRDGDKIKLFDELIFQVIEIPGHTLDHIAYYGHGALFCGDTLFTAGCGRIFEGTSSQMYASLQKLTQLPEDTLIYCGHEYTLQNLMFARTVEPNNPAIHERFTIVTQLREHQQPTVPASLATEKQTNPFLRSHVAEVVAEVQRRFNLTDNDPATIFQYLRQWKDGF